MGLVGHEILSTLQLVTVNEMGDCQGMQAMSRLCDMSIHSGPVDEARSTVVQRQRVRIKTVLENYRGPVLEEEASPGASQLSFFACHLWPS